MSKKQIMRLGGLPALAGALLLTACAEAPVETHTVELTANIVAPPGVEGPIEVRVFHTWSLEGDLRHPMHLIDIFEADTGSSFTRSFEYPNEGEGLAVWAFIDTDGDGVHCTPTVRNDLSGLAVVTEGEVPDQVEATVNLTEPCRAPGWFYPQAG